MVPSLRRGGGRRVCSQLRGRCPCARGCGRVTPCSANQPTPPSFEPLHAPSLQHTAPLPHPEQTGFGWDNDPSRRRVTLRRARDRRVEGAWRGRGRRRVAPHTHHRQAQGWGGGRPERTTSVRRGPRTAADDALTAGGGALHDALERLRARRQRREAALARRGAWFRITV